MSNNPVQNACYASDKPYNLKMSSYNAQNKQSHISRLDDLLNRNHLIYQNLQQKLQGITRYNQQIYRNITNIHSNFTDLHPEPTYLSDESSTVLQEKMIPILPSIQNLIHPLKNVPNFDEYFQEKKQTQLLSQDNEMFNSSWKFGTPALDAFIKRSQVTFREQEFDSSTTKHFQYFENIDRENPSSNRSQPTKNNQIYLQHLRQPQIAKKVIDEAKVLEKNSVNTIRDEANTLHVIQNQILQPKGKDRIVISEDSLQQVSAKTESVSQHRDVKLFNGSPINSRSPQTRTRLSSPSKHSQVSCEQSFKTLCCLFVPFNKLYRSPILQIKRDTAILERESKTARLQAETNRIVDGIKYKFKHIFTDQDNLLTSLFTDFDFQQPQRNNQCKPENLLLDLSYQSIWNVPAACRIAVVGHQDTLKKKIHMGLLAYSFANVSRIVHQVQEHLVCNIEHQQLNPKGQPVKSENSIEIDPGQQKVSLLKVQKSIEQIYQLIKRLSNARQQLNLVRRPKVNKHNLLRISKIKLFSSSRMIWCIDIVSTNQHEQKFLECLEADRICFTINPLIKNAKEVHQTLESSKAFIKKL